MKTRLNFLIAAACFCLPVMGHSKPLHRPQIRPQNAALPLRFDPSKFMRVSELRPGMRGYALTTFKGTTITRFNIEILGVLSKFNQGKDYILFRALDGPCVTRHLNIAHGMSGSPIYVKGRLVGAISMGIPGTQFAKEPTALATPIEEMFDVWNSHLPSSPLPISAKEESNTANSGLPIDYISATGLSPKIMAKLGSELKQYNLSVIAGGGDAGSESAFAKSAKLEPGSAVGISLVQGDVNVSYTGTVTYRDGNRILMFGHPLFDVGPIEAAMTTAYVVDIFPSYQDSIILGSPLKTVGRIQQDRSFSVGGVIGQMPHMIPLEVAVTDDTTDRSKVLHARIIDHPLLSSKFLVSVADQMITDVHSEPGDAMAKVTLDADVEEIGHVHKTNLVYDADSIDQSAIGDLSELVRTVNSNPFYPLRIKKVHLSVHIYSGHDTAEISRIFLKQKTYSPGDIVHVGVVLKPFKRPAVTKDIALVVPANTPAGTLTVTVNGGGSDSSSLSMIPGLIILNSSTDSSAATVAQLVKQFVDKPRNDELVTKISLPTSALDVKGEKLTGLPPNMAAVLQATRSTGLKTERDEVKKITGAGYIVSGSQSLTITIQRKDALSTASGTEPEPIESVVEPATKVSVLTVPAASLSTVSIQANDSDRSSDRIVLAEQPNVTTRFLDTTPASTVPHEATHGDRRSAPFPKKTNVLVPAAPPLPLQNAAVTPSAKAPFKIVGRPNATWLIGTANDFAPGDFQGVSLGLTGGLSVAPSILKWSDTNASVVWSIAPAGDGAYVGTGNDGLVLHIAKSGDATVLFNSNDLEITAVTTDTAGNVFAAAAPSGVLYKITPAGKATKWFTAPEKYITAMVAVPGTDVLYFSVGGGVGKIYRASTNKPGAAVVFTTSELDILSMALSTDGTLYAGTAPNGMVYALSPTGTSRLVTSVTQSDVNAIAVQKNGDLVVGTGPQGALYSIPANGVPKLVADKLPGAVTGLAVSPTGDTWAIADSIIYRVRGQNIQLYSTESDEPYVALAVDGANNVVTATGTSAALYRLAANGAGTGHYDTPVRDAGRRALWGDVTWMGHTGIGDQLFIQTRSGDTSEPDPSWSGWSSAIGAPGTRIQSPAARYLQARVTLEKSSNSADGPMLHSLAITYLPENQRPSVQFAAPTVGSYVSKTVTVSWTGSDPDGDTLSYELYSSDDDGKTWQHVNTSAIKNNTGVKNSTAIVAKPAMPAIASTAAKPSSDAASQIAKLKAELDKHPELPAAVRAQILAHASSEIATQPVTPPSPEPPATGPISEPTFSWDTTHVPDGVYLLKVVASDKASNATGALDAEAISDRFTVANNVPEILTDPPAVNGGESIIKGVVRTSIADVASVQFKLDDGPLTAAEAVGGLFDSANAPFIAHLGTLTKGPHKIEFQVTDQSGNWSTKSVTFTE